MTSLRAAEAEPPRSRTVRPVTALEEPGAKLRRNPVPPPPKIAWLALDQLRIDETYQRDLSHASRALVRRLVEQWDWNRFKPLSVASAGEALYEIIDGQHTAIAAATHGAIETLPCLVLDAPTVAMRAAAFVGINRDRVSLTPFALYRARLAAGEPAAIAVDASLSASGARLVESLRYDVDYPVGTLSCITSLLKVARQGGEPRLSRVLRIMMAGEVTPIPVTLLNAVSEIVATPGLATDEELGEAILSMGGDTIVDAAQERRRGGFAANNNLAAIRILIDAIEAA